MYTQTIAKNETTIVRENVEKEIVKGTLRMKLNKMRHLVIKQAIRPEYLDSLFPTILKCFDPQQVEYNGGIAKIKNGKFHVI